MYDTESPEERRRSLIGALLYLHSEAQKDGYLMAAHLIGTAAASIPGAEAVWDRSDSESMTDRALN